MTPWAGTAERERIGQVGAFAGGAGFDQVGGSPPADERAGPADDDDDDEVDGDAGSHEEFHRAPMTPCAGTAEQERIGQVGAFAGGAGFDQVEGPGSPPADERAGPADDDDDDDDEVDGDAGSHEEFHRAATTPWAGTAERERVGQVGAFAGGAGFDQMSRSSDERAGPADDDDDDEPDESGTEMFGERVLPEFSLFHSAPLSPL
jgi:hypothetical protein